MHLTKIWSKGVYKYELTFDISIPQSHRRISRNALPNKLYALSTGL